MDFALIFNFISGIFGKFMDLIMQRNKEVTNKNEVDKKMEELVTQENEIKMKEIEKDNAIVQETEQKLKELNEIEYDNNVIDNSLNEEQKKLKDEIKKEVQEEKQNIDKKLNELGEVNLKF